VVKSAPLTPEAQLLKRKFGDAFLVKLKALGVTAKKFLYANRLATVGIQNFYKNEFADAMYLFKKAYRLVGSPNLLYFMAITYEKLGSYLKAKRQLEKYLREVKSWTLTPIKRAFIDKAIAALVAVSKKLVSLRLTVNVSGADIFVNGDTVGKSPHHKVIWLMPGRSTLVVFKNGYVKKEVIIREKRTGSTIKRSVALLTPEEVVRKDKRFQEAERRKREADLRRQKMQRQLQLARRAAEKKVRRNQKIYRLTGYSALGSAVAALLVGGVLAIVAEGEERKLEDTVQGDTWLSVSVHAKRADDFRNVAFGLVGGAAVLSITGAVLMVYGYRAIRVNVKERATPKGARATTSNTLRILPTVGPTYAGVTLGLRF
jgi:tetratricopeptide (TPR) repeat protein